MKIYKLVQSYTTLTY